jgi:hypothetical protein
MLVQHLNSSGKFLFDLEMNYLFSKKKKNFEESLIYYKLKRLEVERGILEKEKTTELERLQNNINLFKEGTQARLDAQIEYATKKQEIDNQIAKNEKDAADEKAAREKEQAQKELENLQQLQDLKAQAVLAGLTLISDLTTAFGGKSEKSARKAFNIQKGVSIASATIETFLAAQLAFKSQFIPGVPDPTSPVRGAIAAGIAIAGGLGRVAKIAAQKFEGGGDKSPAPSPSSSGLNAGGSATSGGSISAPIFNLGGQQIGGAGTLLGSGFGQNQQQPVKVFVSETDISAVQNKVQVTEGNSLFEGPQ